MTLVSWPSGSNERTNYGQPSYHEHITNDNKAGTGAGLRSTTMVAAGQRNEDSDSCSDFGSHPLVVCTKAGFVTRCTVACGRVRTDDLTLSHKTHASEGCATLGPGNISQGSVHANKRIR